MAISDASAFAIMSALRDQIESRITGSEDFRAFVALSRELSAYEAIKGTTIGRRTPVAGAAGLPRIVVSDRR